MAEISDLISEMKLSKDADEKRNRGREKDDQAQLTALQDLETTFPGEFAKIFKKSGIVGETKPFEQTALLDQIRLGVDGLGLTFGQRFKDFFTNFAGIFPNRAQRKRAAAADLATALMQADTEDISNNLISIKEFLNNLLSSKGGGALESSVKKPSAGKATNVLAVQMVDRAGKVLGKEKKGAAETEAQREQAQREEKTNTLLQTMADGMGTKGAARQKVESKGSMLDKLKKALIGGAFAALIAAAVWFLNSKYWVKIKEFFVDDFMPFAKMLWEDYLKPIGIIFTDYILKSWETIKTLFTGLKESFALFGEGKWMEGITKFFSSIGTYLGKQIDNLITLVYNLIATVFGLEETDSVWGSIKGFFENLYLQIKFNIVWMWLEMKKFITETWTNIKTSVTKVFTDIKDWFVSLFTWGKKAGATEEGGWSLKTFIDEAFTKVKDWVVSLFTWATEPVGPDDSWIKTTVNAVVTKVQEWALSLFAWAETPGGSWITVKIKEVIKLVQAWVTGLFTWASTAGQVEGEKWSLSALIDAAVLQVITWVKSLFTWATSDEATDPADFSIKGMIKKVLKTIIGWVTSLWAWANTDEATDPAGFSISGMIKKVIKTVVGWVTGLFTWASKAGEVDGKEWSFMTMISAAVNKVIGWVTGIFTWAKKTGTTELSPGEDGEFSLIKLISKTITKIWDWFKDLLDIDLMAMAKNIPGYDTFMKIFNFFGKDKTPEEIKAEQAKTSAGKKKAQEIPDVNVGSTSAAGGPIAAGQWGLVGELGPELIRPNQGGQVLNAQRTQQIMQAGIQRDMGGGAGGGGTTSINTGGNVVSSPTTNYVNNGIAARRPIILAA